MIQAIHTAVKGRTRYKIHQLYGCKSLKTYLERSLVEKAEIKAVSANPLTGNILVLYHPDKTPDEIASLIAESVLNYHSQQQQVQIEGSETIQQLAQMVADAEAQAVKHQPLMVTDATEFETSAEQLRDMVADAEAQAAENQQLVVAGATQVKESARDGAPAL